MNKQEKIISLLLALGLAAWLVHSFSESKKLAEQQREQQKVALQQQAAQAQKQAAATPAKPAPAPAVAPKPAETPKAEPPKPKAPEQFVTLTNAETELTFSTRGAVLKKAKMCQYAEKAGALSAENPALVLDFSGAPALAIEGLANVAPDADFTIAAQTATNVTFKNAFLTRTITLKGRYQIAVEETFAAAQAGAANRLALGEIALGASKNDILSIDSWSLSGKKPQVEHHGETDPLKGYLAGSSIGGCSGKMNAAGLPVRSVVDVAGAREWIAVKNRFFVTALAQCSAPNTGFRATTMRDPAQAAYTLKSVSAAAAFSDVPAKRTYTLYVGPKLQSLLWDLGMKDVMEFGMWRWVCYPMVWVLNLFNSMIPSYGIAIILLTVLVRLVFWPLTHKSTVAMRRMQEIQPKIKEIQKNFKDNPQRLQQETWAVYRENKVNPMASCLPMLVQIPVFIALFTVLRSAVELRYASFLWITDLSEPEALFASWFPFGGLNILPLAMAGLTMLQSKFSPSTGDNKQQQMMMIMMPLIMLVMFYNFPSALSLYWALSTAFGVAQAWWIKRKYGTPVVNGTAIDPDAVEMPQTRQMRRHG